MPSSHHGDRVASSSTEQVRRGPPAPRAARPRARPSRSATRGGAVRRRAPRARRAASSSGSASARSAAASPHSASGVERRAERIERERGARRRPRPSSSSTSARASAPSPAPPSASGHSSAARPISAKASRVAALDAARRLDSRGRAARSRCCAKLRAVSRSSSSSRGERSRSSGFDTVAQGPARRQSPLPAPHRQVMLDAMKPLMRATLAFAVALLAFGGVTWFALEGHDVAILRTTAADGAARETHVGSRRRTARSSSKPRRPIARGCSKRRRSPDRTRARGRDDALPRRSRTRRPRATRRSDGCCARSTAGRISGWRCCRTRHARWRCDSKRWISRASAPPAW